MNRHQINHLTENIPIAIGIILIWRGVWVLLDLLDKWLFGNDHAVTAIVGILLGVLVMYLSDPNLESLERI